MISSLQTNSASQCNPFFISTQRTEDNVLKIKSFVEKSELIKIYDKLNLMKQWKSNWDGYNSEKPKKKSIDNAEKFIKIFYEFIEPSFYEWVSPHITASESGEIVFEWWKNTKKVTVYFAPSKITYIKVGGENIEDMEDGALKLDLNSIGPLWEWLNC